MNIASTATSAADTASDIATDLIDTVVDIASEGASLVADLTDTRRSRSPYVAVVLLFATVAMLMAWRKSNDDSSTSGSNRS